MFLFIPLILFCFYFGFVLSNLLRTKLDRHSKCGRLCSNSTSQSTLFSCEFLRPQTSCNCGILAYSRSCFDPRIPKLSLHADENLQNIFDLIIDRFILRWFSQLTDDEKFTANIKAQLQHICSVLLLRLKAVDVSNLIEQKLLPCVVHHVEHLLTLTNAFFDSNIYPSGDEEPIQPPLADDLVLQRLFSADHLHPALQSRQAESLYLQGIVRQLLPHLLIPPGLKRRRKVEVRKPSAWNGTARVINLIDQAFSSAQFHHQMPDQTFVKNNHLADHNPDPDHTQTAQCARTLLTEILANHVLLPALDSIANPDSLNTVFLYLVDPIVDDTDYPSNAPMVPLLNSYINDWLKNARELPRNMRMEALLQQPKQLANFVQYMKSINCSTTMTVLLLMFEVVNKIETDSVSPALCNRLKAPLQQLLLLLHSGRVLASEELDQYQQHSHWSTNLQTKCSKCGRVVTPIGSSHLPQLLGLSPRLTTVISEAIDSATADANADPLCIARLVHTPEWTSAYKTMCMTMETVYLPAYMESPEYLGRMSAPSASPSPGHHFFPIDVTANFGTENSLDFLDFNPSRRFYKSPNQSISFSDLNEFSCHGVALRTNSMVRDDMSTTFTSMSTTSRGSGRLRFRRHPTPASSVETTKTVEEDLDFSKWRISIPSYTSASRSSASSVGRGGGGLKIPAAATAATTPLMLMMMNLEQPDFSLLFAVPSHGYYTVITEREVNGKKVSSRIRRKYAEFYVLEQRLVEFHGSRISHRLHARRYGAQSHHFLENMKSYFERFLRYLLTQPFLRKSELMYTFLTSPNVEFTSSNLSDIRLGKFVKSMPILLAKEKGQFTDKFLTAFRSSCFILPTQKAPSTTNRHRVDAHTPHSTLEHRLHSGIYWNNAGTPVLQKRVRGSECCAMEGSYVTSFYDFFGYLADNFRRPDLKSPSSIEQLAAKRRLDSTSGKFSVYVDFLQWVQRITLTCWSVLKTLCYEVICALEQMGWNLEVLHHPRLRSNSSAAVAMVETAGTVTYLPGLLRRAILNVGLALRPTQFRDLVDLHMRRQVEQFLRLLVRNDYLAPLLLLLRDSIFFPSPPRSEREKAVRREKVYAGLRQLINRFHLQWFSEDNTLQRRLGRVFEVFQHGKWNKQLTYVLLDHILLELFPDIFVSSSAPEVPTIT
ncbi:Sorting nexin-14 [Echinococcus granulosus]|uniref:Sorting nexin-14 n=1 Tax=Echinococcus granulosus TaxID=6210 RepID=W6U4S8_ECHGR|nr:Sorting nexin-14 [Echinococcus granulosus]EUB56148.1 Sorting nexin-14 [Echinococcus granulosus]